MPAYKDSTTNNWYVKFYYSDWTGQKKQKKKRGFATKREALDFERDFLNKCSTSTDISFANLVDVYLADCEIHLKPTTLANKRQIIETKLLPYFGNMPISSIDILTVRNWQNALQSDPKKYSQTFLRTVHNQLSAIMNFAKKYYKLQSNPAALCGSMGKKKADEMQFWTPAEFNQFIAQVDNKALSAVCFRLLFYSGMREGELLALTLNDFDFKANTINISKSYARLNGKDLIQTPKTPKSKRVITMPPEIMELVRDYASRLYDYSPDSRLFPITKSYLAKEIERGSKAANIKKIRVHDLRHSHASLLIELGFSPLLISERLGHENIETTLNTYSHLYPNKQGELAEALSKIVADSNI